jgi:NTP pyrophosphatase (non-canonical NTP hydrolase)
MEDALWDVSRERVSQDHAKATGRFLYTCADSELSDVQRLAVLAEEFGEVSREVAEEVAGHYKDLEKLRKELIQTAAVCVAWVESIDERMPF